MYLNHLLDIPSCLLPFQMKLNYLITASLMFLLTASRSPDTRVIEPAQLTGNISLALKHGVWKLWKGKPVYQTMILDVVCDRGECRPQIWGYAPRFSGEVNHRGTIEAMKLDNAWRLQVKVTLQSPWSAQVEEANYTIEVLPHKNSWVGAYWGRLNGKALQNTVDTTISPLPQLISNERSHQLNPSSIPIFSSDRTPRFSYTIRRNIPYRTVKGQPLFLDLYQQKKQKPYPTLIAIHGGGWQTGRRSSAKFLEPYLAMGFSVVDIQYRLTDNALAPAAIEDCWCALGWVLQNAKKYPFDLHKIVVTGESAGGHLALATATIPPLPAWRRQCPNSQALKVAAIINWFGPTDVADLLDGPHRQDYAVAWIGDRSNRQQIAEQVSPINYVRKGLPPILSIHGDRDSGVPYSHAVRLHQALTEVGVTNEFLTIRGRGHGNFSREETRQIYATIEDFLRRHDLL
jgi:acetyl esterase/lipase